MDRDQALRIFSEAGALLKGHFRLTSGLHSSGYLQCALVCQQPDICARLCRELAKSFQDEHVDVVVGPALGGVVIAYELARALGARGIFFERGDDGRMTLRRGFAFQPGEAVVVAEDVMTTGGSVAEIVEEVKKAGARVVGVAGFVDRGGAKRFVEGRVATLLQIDLPTWKQEECPLCRDGIPLVKPGSRKDATSPSGG